MDIIGSHRKDYIACASLVLERAQKDVKDHPRRFAELIVEALFSSRRLAEFEAQVNHKTNLRMRKAHDFYGWMAKNEKRGVCRGAFYRSKNYMGIPLGRRSGAKEDKGKSCGVHIEHTIPIKQILSCLWSFRQEALSFYDTSCLPSLLHERFLMLSVCTALTRKEEENCIKADYKQKHPAFSDGELVNLTDLGHVRPFERYNFAKGLKIINVLSGEEIDPDRWTLNDHAEVIKTQDVYQWEVLNGS